MRDADVNTVLGFMAAAQTVLAIYGSPDGPTDPASCYRVLNELLEDPVLLRAQIALAPADQIILVLEEEVTAPLVIQPPTHAAIFPLAFGPACG